MGTLVFTGGHHNSGLPVAQELKSQGWQIVWIGHRYSMWGDTADSAEYKEVTQAGIPFFDLKAGKFYNNFNPMKLLRIPWGFIQAFYYLVKIRPTGIVSFGGYLAVPVVSAGWLLGVPSITHEQTVVAGWANKFISHFVKKIAVSWPESLKYYPKSKAVFTGLPLRKEIIAAKGGQRDSDLLFVTGGKQGSHIINSTVFEALPDLLKRFNVVHQTGTSSLFSDLAKADSLQSKKYSAFGYDSQKCIDALGRAEVVVSRAGAHTTYELLYLNAKCVLIPLPNVSHDEQNQNAQVLANHGLAVVLPQSQLTKQTLLDAIDKCVSLTPLASVNVIDGLPKLLELINNSFTQHGKK